MQGKSTKRPANVGAPQINGGYMYMFTLVSSNECSFSVAYITASSTIHINVVVATRPARLIVWLLLPSVLQLITELQHVN